MAATANPFMFGAPAQPSGHDDFLDDYLLEPPTIDPSWLQDFGLMTTDLPDAEPHAFGGPNRYATTNPPAVNQPTGVPSWSWGSGAFSSVGAAAAFTMVGSPIMTGGVPFRTRQGDPVGSGQSVVGRERGADGVNGSSVSPADQMLSTPTSTNFDYGDFEGYDNDRNYPDISPTSTTNTSDRWVVVSRVVSSGSSNSAVAPMSSQPPPSTGGSGASRASSIAPHPSSATTSFSGYHLGSQTPTTTGWPAATLGHNVHTDAMGLPGSYTYGGGNYATVDQFNSDLYSDAGSFEDAMAGNFTPLPNFRATEEFEHSQSSFSSYPQQHLPHPQHPDPEQQLQMQAQYLVLNQQARMRTNTWSNNAQLLRLNTSANQTQQRALPTSSPETGRSRTTQPQMQQGLNTIRRSESNVQPPRQTAQQHLLRPPATQKMRQVPRKYNSPQAASPSGSTPGSAGAPYQTIVKKEPGIVPSNAPRASSSLVGQRGGRRKHSHLDDDKKKRTNKMRKVVACWRCALQRDPCDDGSPCGRCMMRQQKGQSYYFPCNRSKLPDFVLDFLPPTMTLMHQKQTIEDTVHDQVLQWDSDNPIDVYLTSGYGHALRWKLYEFKPKSNELLGQLQYFQDPLTGKSNGWKKYSPPFGLLKLDQSDDTYFEQYLDQLMDADCLHDLGWTCFEEESEIDKDCFQANLLDMMCKLYMGTRDIDLKELLRAIIRMMIITYIMGHTLTIVEETLPSVLTSVKFSSRPPQLNRHTSPRLANRQLKFFFAILRNNIYEKILKWQQQTFHTSGRKESTWLPSFCAMLGFAMVLEEVQRTLQIQADAKSKKGEMTSVQAATEACNACERIDERFKLLVGLFQCKYRDKKWGEDGSFGRGTPSVEGQAEHNFLQALREMLEEKNQHLEGRRGVPCSPENQCLFTTRLVAEFLLPFLGLP